MPAFDPKEPPDWVKQMLVGAAAAEGNSFHAELRQGEGGSPAISLGAGTYAAPLPVGWSIHPARPFEGRLRIKEGYDVFYRIDSHEDAEAARGGSAILAYVTEPELAGIATTPADVVDDFLISLPGGDPAGKDVIWKCLQPFGGTHVRELVLRCPLVSDELVEHRESIAYAIAEWMGLGRFAPAETPLDLVANTPKLQRIAFEGTVLMRVPRTWKVEVDSVDNGRELYAANDPEGRETLWVTSNVIQVPPLDDPHLAHAFAKRIADGMWSDMQSAPDRWLAKRRETLDDGDILIVRTSEEEERGRTQRRINWLRYAVRDGAIIIAPIHLVTGSEFLGEPDQIEAEALVDREVRNALLVPPVAPDC